MFAILENFRESIPFILLGNIASSLKFELISCKIGLVFFCDGTWYLWTFLLPSTWLQLPWWKIVWCFKSRLHCTRLYIAFKAQKLLKVSEVFWSFTCIFQSKLLCTQSHLTKSEGQNIKLRCYRQWFQWNNTLTVDTDDQKFNCDNADGHSQTGNRKKKMSASWTRKTSSKNKGNEKRLETLFTHCWSNIYLHKLPFIVDLTDIKSWIVFKFS